MIGSARLLNRQIGRLGIDRIELEHVTIAQGLTEVRVDDARIRRAIGDPGSLSMEAEARLTTLATDKSYDVTLDAEARFTGRNRVDSLMARMELPDIMLQPTPRGKAELSGVTLGFDATETGVDAPGRLDMTDLGR